MSRDWILNGKKWTPEFMNHVSEFMAFARGNAKDDGPMTCPCRNCLNLKRQPDSTIERHLNMAGMSVNYTKWVYHGESYSHDADDQHGAYESDNEEDFDDGNADDIPLMLEDLLNSGNRGPGEPNIYEKLFDEAKKELHEGCSTMTRLSFIIKILHLKSYSRMTNTSFTTFMKILKTALPHVNFPESYNEAKKALSAAGLGYQTIHVCKFDCALFWGEHEHNTHCPVCGISRWKESTSKRKIPHKVLRYFPLIPRLTRIFASHKTSSLTRWHKEVRVAEKNIMRHPADGEAWKQFDKDFPDFAGDPRNIRLGFATDGFNPFGNCSNAYSMWPVFVIPYNFPPWVCTDQSNFMLSLLIPGKLSPGKDFHVYMQPLIKDMMELWKGVQTFDESTKSPFPLRAAFLWSIHDYPGYATMSGRSTRGFYACVHCDENPCSESLKNKIGYFGHRRFLHKDHPYRNSKVFNGKKETREAPRKFTQEEVEEMVEKVKDYTPGKNPSKKRKRVAEKGQPTWHLKASLHDLPYFPKLKLAHNLDVMHIEKNICDNILGTLLEIEGKNKDTYSARLDLQKMNIRRKYWLEDTKRSIIKPPAPWTLRKEQKIKLCTYLANCRFPDGYAANIRSCVDIVNGKVSGLKTHDCHILLQRVLAPGLRGIVPKEMYQAIAELGRFFRELCAKTLKIDVLRRLEVEIVVILCKLEKLFPPAFFDVMVHLAIHLPKEALLRGPVQYGWMYPVERRLGFLKSTVRNKARPEGSIAEGYIVDESTTYYSRHFNNQIVTRFNRDNSNQVVDRSVRNDGIFADIVKTKKFGKLTCFDCEHDKMVWYVLDNCDEAQPYIRIYRNELAKKGVTNVDEVVEQNFAAWFKKHVRGLKNVSADLRSLAHGPEKVVQVHDACNVNGARFRTVEKEKNLRTQNSGVMNVAALDDQPETEFYGVVTEIIKLRYPRVNDQERSIYLFRCEWYDLKGRSTGIKDDGYFKSVNTSAVWYKNAPFILAKQAHSCFYLEDTKLGHPWKVVQTFNHRHVYDVPEIEEEDETEASLINKDAYQEDDCSTGRIVNDVDPEDEEEDVEDDSADRVKDIDRIERRLGRELDREVSAANEGTYNSDDEHEVLISKGKGDATSDADTDLDD